MNFAHPRMLWLLLVLVPAVGFFLWWAFRRKQALIRQFVQSRLLAQLTIGVSSTRQQVRIVLMVIAIAFLLLALARPQWGFSWEETAQKGRDIIVAIDASKSMLAADLQPTRLQRAKFAALDLMKLAKNDRLALVGFAGSAFLQCPLTLDDEAFRQSVDVLDPSILPQGGTAISEAVDAALSAFEKEEGENHKVLVLFTDGEDHQEGIGEALKKASQRGLKIFTVGVGTPGGEVIRVPDQRGQLQFLRDDDGNVVKSRLNEKLLQDIASQTGGFYLPLRGANTMESLYENGLKPLPTTEFEAKLVKRFREQYLWPLGIAILLLIIEVLIPDQKKPGRTVPGPEAAGSVMKAVAVLILLCSVAPLEASPATAQRKLNNGEYKEALSEYKRLLEKRPDDLRLHYNGGVAAYQAGEFDEAYKNFQSAAAADDLELQQRAYYNMANSLFRVGEKDANPQNKIASWEQAVKHYESALKLGKGDADAAYNRDLVMKKLEELKKQQEQQKKDDKNDQDKDKKDEEQKENEDNKQDQQKQDREQKDNQQQQDQQKQQKGDDKKEDQKQQNQQQKEQGDEQQKESQQQKPGDEQKEGQQGKPEEKGDESQEQIDQEAQAMQLGQMTPAQAKQLLDAQKGEEKALIFLPPKEKQKARGNMIFKDW